MPAWLDSHFARWPQPWWLVVAIYEFVLVGTWLLERHRIRRYRAATGDPVGGNRRDRSYGPAWLLWLALLQAPLARGTLWKGEFPQSWTVVGLGLAVAVAGAAIRLHAIHHLKENFGYVVAVTDKHRLVTSGPYRRVRHPAYSGLILFFLGVPMILCDLWFLIFTQIVVVVSVTRRVRLEERWMADSFGPEFEAWKARTWLLFPGVL